MLKRERKQGEQRKMKWQVDPSFDPLQDLQNLKEQVSALHMAVIAGQETTEQMINTIAMQQNQINMYRNDNMTLIKLLNQQQKFLEGKY